MRRRLFLLPVLLGAVFVVPSSALDFTSWRSDGRQSPGSSVGQQSSNLAFNSQDSLSSPDQTTYAKFWVGELQPNGGTLSGRTGFGDNPATSPIRDNREQETDLSWTSWRPVTLKTAPPAKPTFTPVIPMGYSPVTLDLSTDTQAGTTDDLLFSVGFEPPLTVAGGNDREQVLNSYYPQTGSGLPGNSSSAGIADRGTVPPFWRRGGTLPGLKIRDLEPLEATKASNVPGVGVVTQPPILARVPAVYTNSAGATISEIHNVVYLVVGTGETAGGSDFARVICVRVDRALPDLNNPPAAGAFISPPNPKFFNPTSFDSGNASHGDVMWSYTVRARNGTDPIPVAGISFANIGSAADSRPRLFLTTADGQVISLNAKSADTRAEDLDGDVALTPVSNPPAQWIHQAPLASDGLTLPGYAYGMSPAVTRVPLTGLFDATSTGKSQRTVSNAISRFNVNEWMVFVADTYGTFRAFEAPGRPVTNAAGKLTRFDPLPRWTMAPPGITFRGDSQGNRERFITPPLVYNGNSPTLTSGGTPVSGSADAGYDDVVIFNTEKGNIYAFDAVGRFTVNGATGVGMADPADDGQPTGLTDLRWKWPADPTNAGVSDTSLTPAIPANEEPRTWPRELAPDIATRGNAIDTLAVADYNDYFSRSPLAGTLGPNSNPNLSSPNLDPGDDAIFVPYLDFQGTQLVRGLNYNRFYQYVGSLKPYGFVQLSRPIQKLVRATFVSGGTTVTIPLRKLAVGSVKANGIPSTLSPNILAVGGAVGAVNPNFDPAAFGTEDTVYLASPSFYDDTNGQYYTVPFGTNITFQYEAPTSTSDSTAQVVTETLLYPSCYRREQTDPNDATKTVIRRTRASLGEAYQRLELRSSATAPAPRDESPSLILRNEFDNFDARPGAMMAAGSATAGGVLMIPSAYRGRVNVMTHRLQHIRTLTGFTHPDLERTGVPATGPFIPADGDPGEFADQDPGVANVPYVEDIPELTDVAASVTLVNGWCYVTYRNGHTRAYSNVGGGATGTDGNPPLAYLPAPAQNGGADTVVWAPEPTNPDLFASPGIGDGGIHLLAGRKIDDVRSIDTTTGKIRVIAARTSVVSDDPNVLDDALMVEYGQTMFFLVDFGAVSRLLPPQTLDINSVAQRDGGSIDGQVFQAELRGQVIGGNGAVQGLPGNNQGVRPQLIDHDNNNATEDHVAAIVPVFCGIPGGNPLTPGTPVLWEREPTSPDWNFAGQITYNVQITQQGVQWRWRPRPGDPANAVKQHYWDQERPNGSTRFPTSGGLNAGKTRWNWKSEWAPLISYNNPLTIQYDPDTQENGTTGPLFGLPGAASGTVTDVDAFTNRNDARRKNGDPYIQPAIDGSRSGSGQPIVPIVGTGIRGSAIEQLLFGDHGRTTPATTTVYPSLAKLKIGDRSFLGAVGQSLRIRVQRTPLTKLGTGAALGTAGDPALANLGAPAGSFEQNRGFLDDGQDGAYSSIPESRLLVTKEGTALDLALNPIPIAGRTPDFQLPALVSTAGRNTMEQLAVQVDIPRYTADDLYGTRWRYANQAGAPAATAVNPFSLFMWDRAERYARGPYPVATEDTALKNVAHQEERTHPEGNVDANGRVNIAAGQFSARDDRIRRVAVFVDANGNGLLDLSPNLREAYRTFAVQVAVKPEMKVEAQQQAVDLGALWHGKKQPGISRNDVGEIQEWQAMNQMAASGNPTLTNLASYYRRSWRPFNLRNTGNVNLAYIKPELVYQIAGAATPSFIAFPSPGNDPWRALTLLTPVASALTDPLQIFLRTSFDDMLLPNAAAPYGAATRGIWLQKATAGSSQPGATAYASPIPSVNPGDRDPSVARSAIGAILGGASGVPRETYLTLNIPTGAALGQYRGSLRFFNDRSVVLVETPGLAPGYRYVRPESLAGVGGNVAANGALDRDPRPATLGEPIEPTTDPPLRVVARVMENVVQGRFNALDSAIGTLPNTPPLPDGDRRGTPAVLPDISASNPQTIAGQVSRLLLGYTSNRANPTQPGMTDIFGTLMNIDPVRGLFPYDEIPQYRLPWITIPGITSPSPFFAPFSAVSAYAPNAMGRAGRPSLAQDRLHGLPAYMAWTENLSIPPTTVGAKSSEQSAIFYQQMAPVASATRLQIIPGGQQLDPGVVRTGVHLSSVPIPAGGNPTQWLAIYSTGSGTHRNLSYSSVTTNGLPNDPTAWNRERQLPTSRSLSTVGDPFASYTDLTQRQPAPLPALPGEPQYLQTNRAIVPLMAWIGYSGQSSKTGRTDIYLSRQQVFPAVTTTLAGSDASSRDQNYGRTPLPRVAGDILQANPNRSQYVSGGADWIIAPYSPVQVYLGRADIPVNAPGLTGFGVNNGSIGRPLPLLTSTGSGTPSTGDEIVFQLNPGAITLNPTPGGQAQLRRVRVIVDPAAGVVKFTISTRSLSLLLFGNPRGITPDQIPDAVLTADYTPMTLRATRGDAAASRPVVLPVCSGTSATSVSVMDASWYRQVIDPYRDSGGRSKADIGLPVAAPADRIWVSWSRSSGAVTGGPTLFYKVLRPGIRVRTGNILGVAPSELRVTVNGVNDIPCEVNPENGQIYFPLSYEGQPVTVTYQTIANNSVVNLTESGHIVNWLDESGERPVPMEASINESGVDGFATFEQVQMTGLGSGAAAVPVTKMERIWLFWSSARGGGDLIYATLAPRIGPDVNVGGSLTLLRSSAPAGLSPSSARKFLDAAAAEERRKPFTAPPIVRRGPFLMAPTAAGARTATR